MSLVCRNMTTELLREALRDPQKDFLSSVFDSFLCSESNAANILMKLEVIEIPNAMHQIQSNWFDGDDFDDFMQHGGVDEETVDGHNNSSSLPDVPSAPWGPEIHKRLLHETMERLGLPLNMKEHEEIIKNMDYDALSNEKRRVKNELKAFDNKYKSAHGTLPQRAEKEPMRPLYTYYKRLKEAIDQQGTNRTSQPQEPIPASNISSNIQQLPGVTTRDNIGNPDSIRTNAMRLSVPSTSPSQPPPSAPSGFDINLLPQKSENVDPSHSKNVSDVQNDASSHPNVVSSAVSPVSGMSVKEIQQSADYKQLRNHGKYRVQLRKILEVFQTEFVRVYNRPISLNADVKPVQKEYNEYKQLKKNIAALEKKLVEKHGSATMAILGVRAVPNSDSSTML
eukprot:GDKK01049473.1.p1 GENE.GDKK01049473.1~~GDKK01049473.1.p1  ORF type:complete len:395 (-),score=75.12 GDKK01049473.1:77-1261(-)